jgi:aminopeptidase-like protein
MKFSSNGQYELPIYFFGTKNFAWIVPTDKNIKSYAIKDVMHKTNHDFKLALEEIEDRSKWPKPEEFILETEELDDFADRMIHETDPNVFSY